MHGQKLYLSEHAKAMCQVHEIMLDSLENVQLFLPYQYDNHFVLQYPRTLLYTKVCQSYIICASDHSTSATALSRHYCHFCIKLHNCNLEHVFTSVIINLVLT